MTQKRTFGYNKLVRDKIIDSMRDKGDEFELTQLDDVAFEQALIAKLLEEVTELQTSPESDRNNELVDINEVFQELVRLRKLSALEIETLMESKRDKSGGFATRSYIGTVTLAQDNPWLEYLLQNPERYPEITS